MVSWHLLYDGSNLAGNGLEVQRGVNLDLDVPTTTTGFEQFTVRSSRKADSSNVSVP